MRLLLQPPNAADPQIRQIVGVARQVKARPDETQELIQVYAPIAQGAIDDIYLLAPSIRAAIARVDAQQLVNVMDVMTLDDVARVATSRHRFRAVAVATFAGLALSLAMVGVFGVMAYSIQQRVREFGVRLALGASRADVLRLVFGSAATVVAAGAVIGVLAVTATLSTAIPAWRATRVDPAAIMKGE